MKRIIVRDPYDLERVLGTLGPYATDEEVKAGLDIVSRTYDVIAGDDEIDYDGTYRSEALIIEEV